MKQLLTISLMVAMFVACNTKNKSEVTCSNCSELLIAYAERYPAAEQVDLYKLFFHDIYGPGHVISDSITCAKYIQNEIDDMVSISAFPLFEYTLCDSNFVRVNLQVVKDGRISVQQLTHAMLSSAEGLPVPDSKFVVSHSAAFKAAYDPHYRLVRRDIFEDEMLPIITSPKNLNKR